jgi:hypothetical protein
LRTLCAATRTRTQRAARAPEHRPPPARAQARQNRLPGMRLPISGLEGARAELLCHAADADLRASAFGVPALTPSAAAAPPVGTPPRNGGGPAFPCADPGALSAS